MTERINVAEILRECPRGTELDSPCFDNVVFDRIDDKGRIRCFCGDIRDEVSFTAYGCLNESPSAKCVIFPRGKESWEEMELHLFKKGDIVYIHSQHEWVAICKEIDARHFYGTVALCADGDFMCHASHPLCPVRNIKEIRFATDEERNKLFDVIQKHGYKWNSETKTLEKLKFDITALKPFDKVLTRDGDGEYWHPNLYGFYLQSGSFHYTCGPYTWNQCIPYEGNEHLLGTKDHCDNYYKTWDGYEQKN